MIRHPSIGRLLDIERGDSVYPRNARVADHVAGCPVCGDTLRRIRQIRSAAAAVTSPALPADGWAAIRARLEDEDAVILPSARPPSRTVRSRPLRWAAAALVLAAAVGAAAVSLPAVLGWIDGAASPAVVSAPRSAGVSIAAPSDEIVVRLIDHGPELWVRVETGEEGLAQVRGIGEAADAEFTATSYGIEVRGAAAGQMEILIPATARLRLEADGHTMLTRDSLGFHVRGAPATTGSRVELRLTGGGSR